MRIENNTLPTHKHVFSPTGEYLPWNDNGMVKMESMLLRMTPEEQVRFGRYTMQYAHLGIMPDIYYDSYQDIVYIHTNGKRYYKYGLITMFLQEGKQVHINTE